MEKAADAYSAAHYHSGVVSVFTGGRAEALDSEDQQMNSKLASSGTFHILLAASKFSTDNFWNGKWRSTWTLDLEKKTLSGAFQANVHYYEDGNVQLDCHKEVSLDLDCDVVGLLVSLTFQSETQTHAVKNSLLPQQFSQQRL